MIVVRQIFFNTDMRQGDLALTKVMRRNRIVREELKFGEVVVFINRKMQLLKAVARHGIYMDRLPKNQHFDFGIRREQILKNIGRWFGMNFKLSNRIVQDARKKLGIKEAA